VDRPGPREVRVRPVNVGLCHSDLHYIDGTHTTDLPMRIGSLDVTIDIGELRTGCRVRRTTVRVRAGRGRLGVAHLAVDPPQRGSEARSRPWRVPSSPADSRASSR
jgi:hypothetical protein